MALVPSFSITTTSNPSSFTIADTSSGSDGAITDRQILLYDVNNNLIVAAIDFPISQNSITISPLTKDIALDVRVDWNNSTGTPLYTYDLLYAFVGFALQFLYQLTQFQIANPQMVNDLNWYGNKQELFTLMLSAQNAINTGQDQANAQNQIVLYQKLINNQNDYF